MKILITIKKWILLKYWHQFTKFTNNILLDYSSYSDGETISKGRIIIIKNFLYLAKLFSHSGIDQALKRQINVMKIFDNNNELGENELDLLINENIQDTIFSFESIKSSLVFFNRDGGSISIITNTDKNNQEYKDLKELWNTVIKIIKKLIIFEN